MANFTRSRGLNFILLELIIDVNTRLLLAAAYVTVRFGKRNKLPVLPLTI